jgi:perosamine synthetase
MKAIDESFCKQVVGRLADILPAKASLHEPRLEGNENKYVSDCVQSGWVSSVGSYVDRFEADLQKFTGASHAVAISNGTSALHLALLLAGVNSEDEVLTPALSFIATANAISYCGAVPHFIDSESVSLGVDADKLDEYLSANSSQKNGVCVNTQTGAKIKALVCMHVLGHPVNLDKLVSVCKKHRLKLIEDAAESLGSYYKGQHTGNHGILSALSFNGNKIATTGGGGAILTNNPELAARAKHLSTTAKTAHAWEFNHDQIGYNYRLPNINAALGCAQLEQMPLFLETKRTLANTYIDAFQDFDGLEVFQEPGYAQSNYWLNAIILDEADNNRLEGLLSLSNSAGLMTRPLWEAMHRLPMYHKCPRMDLSVTEGMVSRVICLPSSSKLGSTVD